MKTFIALLAVGLSLVCSAPAQQGGVLLVLSSNTVVPPGRAGIYAGQNFSIPQGATNFFISTTWNTNIGATNISTIADQNANGNLTCEVKNYANVGFTFRSTASATPIGDTNTAGVLIFRSFDNRQTWDLAPFWSFTSTNAAAGGQTFFVSTNLPTLGVTDLGFSIIDETGIAGAYHTNLLLEVNCQRFNYDVRTSPY